MHDCKWGGFRGLNLGKCRGERGKGREGEREGGKREGRNEREREREGGR